MFRKASRRNLFKLNQWNSLDELNALFKPWTFLKKPAVAKNWDEDVEFGHQRLCGINPAFIRKCKPEDIRQDGKFPITDEVVGMHLENGSSVSAALAGDRFYLLDYEILNNITTPELEDQLGRYSVAPLCLLYVNQNSNPIFTPNSPARDWLTAKVAVASADIAYQGIISHLLNTHLVIETFAVSTFRKFSPQQIIFQILQPHFFNTFAINEMARSVFLGHNGFFDSTGALGFTGSNELLQRAYTGEGRDYQGEPLLFYQLAVPFDLEKRDVNALPNYYYRDDALLIWEAIKEYVSEVLHLRYKSPADLANDSELQEWKNELVSPHYGRIQGLLAPEKSAQINGKLDNLADLCEIITNIIFTASAQHSAVNFGQYDYAAWVPNMPFATYRPFTDLLGNKREPKVQLLERLPNRLQTIKQIILVNTLSMPTPYSSKSLLTMDNPFRDEPARNIFQKFQNTRLLQIEQKIAKRNASLSKAYTYLLPSKIAQSIAI